MQAPMNLVEFVVDRFPVPGGHEVIFSNPTGLADKIIEAGRD